MSQRIFSLAAALAVAAVVPLAAQAPALDNHYVDSNEVFIAQQEATEGGYTAVALARMLEEPSARTRGEGQFLVIGTGAGFTAGQRVWTRYYWRTRIATPEDVRLGKQVFVPELSENGVYRQPNDRQEAVNGGWWTAAITDLTDMYKQQVTAAGEYHVGVSAMRVAR
jgi:hypothetical protein